ncbi:MAG TPA: DUF5709 domain-containing protein [Sporichthya sp.]|jgi:hypothetical protein|nr:DUF5709 domain-containing protein [Sporichthya sp.]
MSTPDGAENEFYNGYSVDDEDQPQAMGDSLADDRGLKEPLDEGYSPPEKWSAGQRYGNTEWEEQQGETLDQRLAQEEPEIVADEREIVGGEVGAERAGRLVEDDAGARPDTDKDLFATDVGVDGAGASAEEAAVHVIPDPDEVPDAERVVDEDDQLIADDLDTPDEELTDAERRVRLPEETRG